MVRPNKHTQTSTHSLSFKFKNTDKGLHQGPGF